MKTIILASASPRRKNLLKQIGLEFQVHPSEIEEYVNPRLNPQKQAEALSFQKANAVASNFENSLIIGADTIVVYENKVIGKPKDEKDAKRILKKLSGKQHVVITGITIIDTESKKIVTKSTVTKIWFRALKEQEISNYIQKEKPFDKAGAYALHELAAVFAEKIEGDFWGAIGISVYILAKELKKFGVEVL